MCVLVDEGVVAHATEKVKGRLAAPGSEFGEGAQQESGVCEVWEDGVRRVSEEFVRGVAAPRGDGDGARAEVSGAGDVVGRVADDDELFGVEVAAQLTADALARDGGQVAP